MRLAPALLVPLLLLPLVAAQSTMDLVQEVREGAPVHLYLQYEGGASGSVEGEEREYALREEVAYRTSWEAPVFLLWPPGAESTRGGFTTEWTGSASRTYVYDFDGGRTNKRHAEWTCAISGFQEQAGGSVEARLEGEHLRLTISTFVPSMSQEDGCAWWQEDTTSDGVKRDSGTQAFTRRAPLHHFLRNDSYQASFEVVVPLEGRASFPASFSSPVPAPEGSPEWMYCGLTGDREWATGSCAASGTLTVRAWVQPCGFIERRLAQRVADLASVAPPPQGADEAAVQSWAASVQPQIAAVLRDARAYLLLCGEDLPVDPWDAIVRAQRLHRDALLGLSRDPGLSPEGTRTVLGVERTLQLMGVDDGVDLSFLDGNAAAPVEGTMEVSVHSPVALHLWSEDGGHVGWNASTERAESTIPGATYEGAPGGAQRIVVPAGFYRVTVDEMEVGSYLLDVRAAGAAWEANESWLVAAAPGRTTSTHYGVLAIGDATSLQTFPVHRTALEGDAAGAPGAGDGASDEAGSRGIPGVGVVVLLAVAAAARISRRRTP